MFSAAGSPRASTPIKHQTKTEPDISNLKTMPKGLSASLPDLDSESWIEVKKRPRPSPARPKVSAEKVKFRVTHSYDHIKFSFQTFYMNHEALRPLASRNVL